MTIKTLTIRGSLNFTPSNPPRPPGRYVFQRVGAGFGNLPDSPDGSLQLRRHVIPVDPRTEAQIARRNKMASAVSEWHALTPAEKALWAPIGERRGLSGFNAFISAGLTGVIPTGTALWDEGAAEWDGGTAQWDI